MQNCTENKVSTVTDYVSHCKQDFKAASLLLITVTGVRANTQKTPKDGEIRRNTTKHGKTQRRVDLRSRLLCSTNGRGTNNVVY